MHSQDDNHRFVAQLSLSQRVLRVWRGPHRQLISPSPPQRQGLRKKRGAGRHLAPCLRHPCITSRSLSGSHTTGKAIEPTPHDLQTALKQGSSSQMPCCLLRHVPWVWPRRPVALQPSSDSPRHGHCHFGGARCNKRQLVAMRCTASLQGPPDHGVFSKPQSSKVEVRATAAMDRHVTEKTT